MKVMTAGKRIASVVATANLTISFLAEGIKINRSRSVDRVSMKISTASGS